MKWVVYLILVSFLAFTSCKKDSNPISPSDDTSTVTYSGKVYHTVKIGGQTWLKENLDVGTMLPSSSANPSDNGTIEKYCYNNDPANCTIYGGLYKWEEAMQYVTTGKAKGICPTGWHIPTKAEFETLAAAVGNNSNALKAIGSGTGAGAGINTSGFSALLVGHRYGNGVFSNLGNFTAFWSSEDYDVMLAYTTIYLRYNDSDIGYDGTTKENGFSVRCLKND